VRPFTPSCSPGTPVVPAISWKSSSAFCRAINAVERGIRRSAPSLACSGVGGFSFVKAVSNALRIVVMVEELPSSGWMRDELKVEGNAMDAVVSMDGIWQAWPVRGNITCRIRDDAGALDSSHPN